MTPYGGVSGFDGKDKHTTRIEGYDGKQHQMFEPQGNGTDMEFHFEDNNGQVFRKPAHVNHPNCWGNQDYDNGVLG